MSNILDNQIYIKTPSMSTLDQIYVKSPTLLATDAPSPTLLATNPTLLFGKKMLRMIRRRTNSRRKFSNRKYRR